MELTKREASYLADSISIHVLSPPGLVKAPPYPDMMLKIMQAVVAHEENSLHEFKADFDLDELMLIYEVAKTSVVIATEMVGYNLLIKASTEILALTEGKTALDERVYGEFSDDHTESNTSDTEDRASDGADTQVSA